MRPSCHWVNLPICRLTGCRPFSRKKAATAMGLSSTPMTWCPCSASQIISLLLPQSGTNTRLPFGRLRVGQNLISSGLIDSWWNPVRLSCQLCNHSWLSRLFNGAFLSGGSILWVVRFCLGGGVGCLLLQCFYLRLSLCPYLYVLIHCDTQLFLCVYKYHAKGVLCAW